MPKTFQEILPALEERLEQAQQGALPIGHAMELRRREQRQAMGCPTDEEICGYVDGELRAHGAKRWAEVRWHVNQCPNCLDDVEGLCEALELDPREVAAAHQPMRRKLFRFVAPIAAVAAVVVFAVLGLHTYIPMLPGWSLGDKGIQAVEPSVNPSTRVERPSVMQPKGMARPDATMNVSISPEPPPPDPSVLRVAVCSETERPTCEDGMELVSVVGAKCKVTGDENACSAESDAGGCAVCLVANVTQPSGGK